MMNTDFQLIPVPPHGPLPAQLLRAFPIKRLPQDLLRYIAQLLSGKEVTRLLLSDFSFIWLRGDRIWGELIRRDYHDLRTVLDAAHRVSLRNLPVHINDLLYGAMARGERPDQSQLLQGHTDWVYSASFDPNG